MYSPFYRTPRAYLSGYLSTGQPLPPRLMMDDIVGDYKDKTVTVEDFPFVNGNVKMASVHPCKHASVMKTLLDRADAALRVRREKQRTRGAALIASRDALVDEMSALNLSDIQTVHASAKESKGQTGSGDEWEEVEQHELDDDEVAIRVDQYMVVFLKVRL